MYNSESQWLKYSKAEDEQYSKACWSLPRMYVTSFAPACQ